MMTDDHPALRISPYGVTWGCRGARASRLNSKPSTAHAPSPPTIASATLCSRRRAWRAPATTRCSATPAPAPSRFPLSPRPSTPPPAGLVPPTSVSCILLSMNIFATLFFLTSRLTSGVCYCTVLYNGILFVREATEVMREILIKQQRRVKAAHIQMWDVVKKNGRTCCSPGQRPLHGVSTLPG